METICSQSCLVHMRHLVRVSHFCFHSMNMGYPCSVCVSNQMRVKIWLKSVPLWLSNWSVQYRFDWWKCILGHVHATSITKRTRRKDQPLRCDRKSILLHCYCKLCLLLLNPYWLTTLLRSNLLKCYIILLMQICTIENLPLVLNLAQHLSVCISVHSGNNFSRAFLTMVLLMVGC